MSETAVITYSPAEAGGLIGQTENWMKEKARAGLIPHSRIGRAIRFTPRQLAEIVRAGEQRPRPHPASRPPARRKDDASPTDGALLEAKPPRRKRNAA